MLSVRPSSTWHATPIAPINRLPHQHNVAPAGIYDTLYFNAHYSHGLLHGQVDRLDCGDAAKKVATMPASSQHAQFGSPGFFSSPSSPSSPSSSARVLDESVDHPAASSPAMSGYASPPTQPACPRRAAAAADVVRRPDLVLSNRPYLASRRPENLIAQPFSTSICSEIKI